MSQKIIRDSRPFIKTAVEKGNFMEVSRINITTNKMYVVRLKRDLYISFIKSQKQDLESLNELTKVQIDFLVRNIIPGEIRN